jgi:hypothetical protein
MPLLDAAILILAGIFLLLTGPVIGSSRSRPASASRSAVNSEAGRSSSRLVAAMS